MNQANKQVAKVALVTGSARRIGAEIVKTLHATGFKVVIHCHQNQVNAQSLAKTLNQQRPDSALVLQKNLSDPDAAFFLIQKTIAWAGRLDALINNASVFSRSNSLSSSADEWESVFELNVKAPYLLSLEARSYLAQHQGIIINITDIHAQKPLNGYAVYCQSKAALEMQTKALACEFAPLIRVNGIAPGAIAWPERGNALSMELQEKIIAKTPLNRHGEPLFIAKAVLSLIENPFITGQILNVDGGRSIA